MHVQAVLFDYGGTLDGAGRHWLPRFLETYRAAGLPLTFDRFRAAFDHATRCAYQDARMGGLGLQGTIAFHVARQIEHLGVDDRVIADRVIADRVIADRVITEFVRDSRAALEESRAVLTRVGRRVTLGVISNFYGNLDRILEEVGVAPLLATIVDSGRVGLHKPAPEIFALAVQRIGCAPAEALYVGDSFEKDIVGARAAGLHTAWLVGPTERSCPAPDLVDVRLRALTDVEAIIA